MKEQINHVRGSRVSCKLCAVSTSWPWSESAPPKKGQDAASLGHVFLFQDLLPSPSPLQSKSEGKLLWLSTWIIDQRWVNQDASRSHRWRRRPLKFLGSPRKFAWKVLIFWKSQENFMRSLSGWKMSLRSKQRVFHIWEIFRRLFFITQMFSSANPSFMRNCFHSPW